MAAKSRIQESIKRKSECNRDIMLLYKPIVEGVEAWAKRHPGLERLTTKLKYKAEKARMDGRNIINEWKHDTPLSVIDREWSNVILTANRQRDIAYAFFNVVEGGYDDSELIVEDLIEGRISPQRYLKVDVKTGKHVVASAQEMLDNQMREYQDKRDEYYKKKEPRDKLILSLQSIENKRHGEQTKVIADWGKAHEEYKPAYEWMVCLEQDTHKRVMSRIGTLSLDEESRSNECANIDAMLANDKTKLSNVIATMSRLCVRLEEERAAAAAKAKAEEEARQREEEERLRREEEERKREKEERHREEEERLRKEEEAKVQSMLDDLKDKFNAPKKSESKKILSPQTLSPTPQAPQPPKGAKGDSGESHGNENENDNDNSLERKNVQTNKRTNVNNVQTNKRTNVNNVQTNKRTNVNNEKEMTKQKETIKREVKARPMPQEDLIIATDENELDALVLDTFDVNIANHCCVQGDRIIFSKKLSMSIIDEGYSMMTSVAQNGSIYFVFRRDKGATVNMEEAEQNAYYCTVDSKSDADAVIAFTNGNARYQEYVISAGIDRKHDYMYAKIITNY